MEVLFDPAVAGKTGAGLAEAIDASISKVELEKRIPLYENIVLSGGLSAAKGWSSDGFDGSFGPFLNFLRQV
jgi:actin-related protein